MQQQRPDYASPMPVQSEEVVTKPASKMPWVVLGVVVLVLLVLGFVFRDKLMGKPAPAGQTPVATTNGTQPGPTSDYQAIFLTNGQVYFGKLTNPDADYVMLSDIYYLQVGPQQGSATAPNQPAANPQQQISLVKLGNELHGPVDQMHISRSQVLFYEDLKSDGQVVKAIMQDKASKTAPAPTK